MKRLILATALLALSACNHSAPQPSSAQENLTETVNADECPRADGQPCK